MDSVFQSYIEYLPKEIILKKYGKTEAILEVREKYNQTLRPIHYKVYREEIDSLWEERELNIEEVLEDLTKINLTENSILNKPKEGRLFKGNFGRNYYSIHYDVNSKQINYFQFGIDITKRETINFVNKIIEIALNNNFIILGSDLKTFQASKEELDKYFRKSPAYKMLKTEDEFLKRVKEGKEKTDVPFFILKK